MKHCIYIASKIDLWLWSRSDKLYRRGEARGRVQRTYRILGRARAFLRRQRASCECRSFTLSPRSSNDFFLELKTAGLNAPWATNGRAQEASLWGVNTLEIRGKWRALIALCGRLRIYDLTLVMAEDQTQIFDQQPSLSTTSLLTHHGSHPPKVPSSW